MICDLRRENGGVYTAEERRGEKTHGVKPAGCCSYPFYVCFCGCEKFTSASIGERLHPRHASSQSVWTREGWRAKRWGREWGGQRCNRGQCVGRLIWVGGWGVVVVGRGGNTLTFHVPPFLFHSLSLSVSLVVPLSLSISHPRRVSRRGCHGDPVAVALLLRRDGRVHEEERARGDGRLKCKEGIMTHLR